MQGFEVRSVRPSVGVLRGPSTACPASTRRMPDTAINGLGSLIAFETHARSGLGRIVSTVRQNWKLGFVFGCLRFYCAEHQAYASLIALGGMLCDVMPVCYP